MLSLVFQVTVIHRITGTFGVRCCGVSFTMIIFIFNKHRTFFKIAAWSSLLSKGRKSNSNIYFCAIQHSKRSWVRRCLAFNRNLKIFYYYEIYFYVIQHCRPQAKYLTKPQSEFRSLQKAESSQFVIPGSLD